MAAKFEKKEIPITMKVSESLEQKIEDIARNEDRPKGYVARELMIRGLALFEIDGKLRGDPGLPFTEIRVGNKKAPVVAKIEPAGMSKKEIQKMLDEQATPKPHKRKTG